jgi:hypothetical protein
MNDDFDDLLEPVQTAVAERCPQRCGIGGCKRGGPFRVLLLLYPQAPMLAAPTYRDYGARVEIGRVCKKHKKAWTAASHLDSRAWTCSENAKRFHEDFGGSPDVAAAQIEVVRA